MKFTHVIFILIAASFLMACTPSVSDSDLQIAIEQAVASSVANVSPTETLVAGLIAEIAELENSLLLFQDKRVLLTTSFNQYLNREANIEIDMPDNLEVIELLLNKESLNDSILIENEKLKSEYLTQVQ